MTTSDIGMKFQFDLNPYNTVLIKTMGRNPPERRRLLWEVSPIPQELFKISLQQITF
jgi:hypothetical protein